MPDPYATIADAEPPLQERLSDVLEIRASDAQQRAMARAYLSEVELGRGASTLEIGCGTGAMSRALVEWRNFEVTGVDPSPVFVARARELGKDLPGLTFMQGDDPWLARRLSKTLESTGFRIKSLRSHG